MPQEEQRIYLEKQEKEPKEKYADHLEKLQEQAWEALKHHKDQVSKLVYWSGSLLIALLATTRLFGEGISGDNSAAIKSMMENGWTVITVFTIFYGFLGFFLHHHLAGKFYVNILIKASCLHYESAA